MLEPPAGAKNREKATVKIRRNSPLRILPLIRNFVVKYKRLNCWISGRIISISGRISKTTQPYFLTNWIFYDFKVLSHQRFQSCVFVMIIINIYILIFHYYHFVCSIVFVFLMAFIYSKATHIKKFLSNFISSAFSQLLFNLYLLKSD